VSLKKHFTLGKLAGLVELELVGDAGIKVDGLGTLSNAGPSQISFLSNPAYTAQLADCRAAAVILSRDFASKCPVAVLLSDQPYLSLARVSALFAAETAIESGTHPSACVDATATVASSASIGANAVVEAGVEIGEHVVIGPGCFVGKRARIGANSILHANVTLYDDVRLGRQVRVHSSTVIGADGFGYASDGERSIKIHQLGGVRIGDDVEIGAGTTIDRGAIDDTVIEQGVKIDNQVQIAHNCHIGANSIICGCTALAGSVKLGKHCVLGGAVGVINHVSLTDGVQVSAMSLVNRSITRPGAYSSGTGLMTTGTWKRNIVRFRQLDAIARKLKELESSTDKK